MANEGLATLITRGTHIMPIDRFILNPDLDTLYAKSADWVKDLERIVGEDASLTVDNELFQKGRCESVYERDQKAQIEASTDQSIELDEIRKIKEFLPEKIHVEELFADQSEKEEDCKDASVKSEDQEVPKLIKIRFPSVNEARRRALILFARTWHPLLQCGAVLVPFSFIAAIQKGMIFSDSPSDQVSPLLGSWWKERVHTILGDSCFPSLWVRRHEAFQQYKQRFRHRNEFMQIAGDIDPYMDRFSTSSTNASPAFYQENKKYRASPSSHSHYSHVKVKMSPMDFSRLSPKQRLESVKGTETSRSDPQPSLEAFSLSGTLPPSILRESINQQFLSPHCSRAAHEISDCLTAAEAIRNEKSVLNEKRIQEMNEQWIKKRKQVISAQIECEKVVSAREAVAKLNHLQRQLDVQNKDLTPRAIDLREQEKLMAQNKAETIKCKSRMKRHEKYIEDELRRRVEY